MKTCKCPRCGAQLPVEANRKLAQVPNYSVLGRIGSLVADLRDFDRVICPKCGCDFQGDGIRMFNVIPRRFYWVPFAFLGAVLVAFWFYVRQP